MHYFLKTTLFVAGVLLFFSYIAYSIPSRPSLPPEEGKIDFNEVKTKQDLVSLGQKIFFSKGQCALCHSIGHSETARCPDLQGVGAKLSREFIYESLTQPDAFIYKQYEFSPPKPFAARMPQINKPPIGLNENEILAVIAFVQSTSGSEYVTVDPSELVQPAEDRLMATGDSARGASIYRSMGCAGCHEGAEAGAAIARRDPLHLMSVLQGGRVEEHRGFEERLTVKQLNDLMAYMAGREQRSESL